MSKIQSSSSWSSQSGKQRSEADSKLLGNILDRATGVWINCHRTEREDIILPWPWQKDDTEEETEEVCVEFGKGPSWKRPGYSDTVHCLRQFFHFRARSFLWKRMIALGFQSSLCGPARDGSWRMLELRWTPDLPSTSSPTPLQSVPSTKQWTMNIVALGLTREVPQPLPPGPQGLSYDPGWANWVL